MINKGRNVWIEPLVWIVACAIGLSMTLFVNSQIDNIIISQHEQEHREINIQLKVAKAEEEDTRDRVQVNENTIHDMNYEEEVERVPVCRGCHL